MFCDEKWWHIPKRDVDWEMFQPCLDNLNKKRQDPFRVVLLMLDESMSQWRPKTTKFGGLPNVAHEPRKLVPLGTQFKNAAECLSGCFSHQDVAQGVERQRRKNCCFVDRDMLIRLRSSVPTHPLLLLPLLKHCAKLTTPMLNLAAGSVATLGLVWCRRQQKS